MSAVYGMIFGGLVTMFIWAVFIIVLPHLQGWRKIEYNVHWTRAYLVAYMRDKLEEIDRP